MFSEKWLYRRIIKTYYILHYRSTRYSYMFADLGLAEMIWEKGGVVERMGVGLIHWPSIVSKQLGLVVGVVFKSQSFF